MPDSSDRRARKKEQTRTEVREAAHRLFAERGFEAVTIADVAEEADVAVQTVFNHFATKEELFFAGRTPWVDRPAEAVRGRAPGASPIETLRVFLREEIEGYADSIIRQRRRRYLDALRASPALRAAEWRLFLRAERTLAAAVLEAWESEVGPSPQLRLAADLVAAQFLSAGRVLVVAQRRLLFETEDGATDADIAVMTSALLDTIALGLQLVAAREGLPDALGAVARLEPLATQAETAAALGSTTGSSTSETSSSTSAEDSGTAKAV